MATPHEHHLSQRRRRIYIVLLRTGLTSSLLVVAYYLAPLDNAGNGWVAFGLAIGLVALGAAVAWQIRAILASATPLLRAIQTVVIGLPSLLLLYASVYALMSNNDGASFTQELDRTGALYFTMTVFTTVGFGDISPVADSARIVTMTQMVVGLGAVGVVARLLLGAVHRAAEKTGTTTAGAVQQQDELHPLPDDRR